MEKEKNNTLLTEYTPYEERFVGTFLFYDFSTYIGEIKTNKQWLEHPIHEIWDQNIKDQTFFEKYYPQGYRIFIIYSEFFNWLNGQDKFLLMVVKNSSYYICNTKNIEAYKDHNTFKVFSPKIYNAISLIIYLPEEYLSWGINILKKNEDVDIDEIFNAYKDWEKFVKPYNTKYKKLFPHKLKNKSLEETIEIINKCKYI